jgi:hypothetical protein
LAGRARFVRRFGYPGRLDTFERVWLTFAGMECSAEVSLNGTALGKGGGAGEPFEFEVTHFLQDRNYLQVDVEASGDDSYVWEEVALEIRCRAFLRGVCVSATTVGEKSDLHVLGEVVGTSEETLELYVLLDNATVAYAVVQPAPEGRPFHITVEQLPQERWQQQDSAPHPIRVDLVNGALIWHTEQRSLALGEPVASAPTEGLSEV